LCCKGSCEFVESSLRTVILTAARFFDPGKMETELLKAISAKPPQLPVFWEIQIRVPID